MISTAFVLAAGRGERLRPLTDSTPKPLLPVAGKPMLTWILESLTQVPTLKKIVFNAWHLGDQISEFAKSQRGQFPFTLEVSVENELLGTGGGLKKASALIGPAPFLMMNGDSLWSGDLFAFVTSALQAKPHLSTWWLTEEEKDQTRIGLIGDEIVQMGSLWKKAGTASASEFGCFSGIQVVRELHPTKLPDKGCIIRNFFLPELASGAILRGVASGLKFWSDVGTPERYQRISQANDLPFKNRSR